MLIDFAITNYRSIKGTIHLNMVFNTKESNEELDKKYNHDNYIDFFKAFSGNGDSRINVCPVMALFGANASGKSNILKAFLALRAIVSNGHTENFYTPFKFSEKTENAPTKFEITFSNDSETNPCIYKYEIEYSAHRIEQERLLKVGKTEDVPLYDTNDFDTIPQDMWQLFITRRKPIVNIFNDLEYTSDPFNQDQKDGLNAVTDFFNKIFIADDINFAPLSVPTKNDLYEAAEKKQLIFDTVKNWLFRMDMRFCDIDIQGEIITDDERGKFSELSLEYMKDIETQKTELAKNNPGYLVTFERRGEDPVFTKYKINMKYEKDCCVKKDGKDNTVSVNYVKEESTGTKNLFRFLFVLIDALQHGKIVVFDEIDRTIHTELLKFLFGVMQATNLNKHGAQMICSSHNPYIIETVGCQGTMFVEKGNDLSTNVRFLSEYEYNINTVLNDYLNGRFGGTPRVVDVFETMEVPNAT